MMLNNKGFKKNRRFGMSVSVEPKGNMAKIFKIVNNKSYAKIGGILVDTFSASGLANLDKALKKKKPMRGLIARC